MNINLYPRHVVVVLVAAVAAVSALAQWHKASTVERGTVHYYDKPADRCLARGVEHFDEQGEWPVTREGIDSRSINPGLLQS